MLFVCWGITVESSAQITVNLNSSENKNRQSVDVRLYDNYTGNYLCDLKLTFHIAKDNILFMIVGDDNGINNNTIWMFDEAISLSELSQKNKNLIPDKEFKKLHKQVEPVLKPSINIGMVTGFQNNYEFVQSTPRPVFFRIKDTTIPIELKLKFYISQTSGKDQYIQLLTAEAGITKVTINIK
jgi:hypothetical protein